MSSRALSFGAAADAYERFRLGYPDEVADLVLGYATAPVARALEVGAGTGKATRLFAGRGVEVTACEPDPQMAAVLRRTCADLPVEVVVSSFEAYGLAHAPGFDLLYAASAWHWTEPATRWSHAAALLRPGGTAAFFGGGGQGSRIADPALRETVADVRRRFIADEERITHARSGTGMWWPGSELENEPAFDDLVEHDILRTVERSRADYLGSLGTVSAYLVLSEGDRTTLLAELAAVLPDTVTIEAAVRLHLARRL